MACRGGLAHASLDITQTYHKIVETMAKILKAIWKFIISIPAGKWMHFVAGAFIALFVGLFRHADNLALAMDARCYGASPERTTLPDSD